MARPVTVLDLFAGVGGASFGLALSGFDVLGVEFWPDAVAAHRIHAPCVEADLSSADWMNLLPSLEWDGVWSSFPCQAWSQAGKRLGAKDPRNGWPWTFDALCRLRPCWFLAENVKGLTTHAKSKGCTPESRIGAAECPACYLADVILPQLRTLYPHVEYRILDAADYGVPQRRHRLILWAGPAPFRWPEPTHSGSALAHAKWGEDRSYWRSAGIPAVGAPSRDEVRALRLPDDGRAPWRTMRQALGINLAVCAQGETGMGRPRSPDDSSPTVSTMGTMYAVRVVGGRNPHSPGAADERNHRDLTDEPSVTMTAAQVGNAGPWIETGQTSEHADGRVPIAISVDEPAPAMRAGSRGAPELVDAPSPTVTTTEEKGTRASAASDWTMNGGPDRASDALWLATGRRRLTPAECAVLQGFDLPSDAGDRVLLHAVAGMTTKSAQYKAVGNAVPPMLAKCLGLAVWDTLRSADDAATPVERAIASPPETGRSSKSFGGRTMNYVSFVRGNLKGLPEEGVALGPKTLIVAPSRRGKSRIANAVTLALEGFVEDVAGAAVLKQGAELASLAPGREGRLWSEVTISDGRTASYSMIAKDGGSTGKKHNGIAGSCPLPEVRAALTGSPEKAYAFLIGTVLGAKLKLEDVVARVGAHEVEAVKRAVASAPGATTAARLLAAVEDAKRALAEARKAEKTAKAALEALQGSSGLAPTEQALEGLRKAFEGVVAYEALRKARNASSDALLDGEARMDQLRAAHAALVREHAAAAKPSDTDTKAIVKVTAARMLVDAAKTDACPVCRTDGVIEKARATVAKAEAAIDTRLAAGRAYAERERKIAQFATSIEELSRKVEAAVGKDPVPDTGVAALDAKLAGLNLADIAKEADAARKKYFDAKKASDALAAIQRQKALQTKAAADVTAADALVTALGSAIEQLVDAAVADFTRRVQDHLPADMPFGCSLKAGERRTFEVGLRIDDVLYTALSGAEWAYVMLAVTLAVSPGDLTVCVPEERAVDPKTLADVMRALTSAPAQVILTSVVMPAGRMPAGWTVIDLSGDEKAEKPKRGRPKKDAPAVDPVIAEHARQVEAFADDLDEATGTLPTLDGDPDDLEV